MDAVRKGVHIAILLSPLLVQADEIYRWVDSDGGVHFGDRPPPGVAVERQVLERAVDYPPLRRVEKVADGDTLLLEGGDKVRLIGVNAPEIPHRNRPGEPGGEEATAWLRERIEGRRVRLAFGPEREDRYGRLLAHVHDEEGASLNEALLRNGLGYALYLHPNTTRAERYTALDREAREAERGIWRLPRYRVIPAAEAKSKRNTFQRLRGEVERIERRGKYIWLHLKGTLRLFAESDRERAFNALERNLDKLKGHEIVVRGWVRQREGLPAIRLDHPLQIESVQ